MYVDAAYSYTLSSMVCQSVCYSRGLGWAQGTTHYMGSSSEGESKVSALHAMSCAKTAETTEMPFGMWTRAGQRKHVLHGSAHW